MLLRRLLMLVAVVILTAQLLMPAQAVAQGRGRGRGLAKKQSKFINGHDARAGRWDGRGPRPRLGVWTYRRRRHHRLMIRRQRRLHTLHIR